MLNKLAEGQITKKIVKQIHYLARARTSSGMLSLRTGTLTMAVGRKA